MSAKVYGEKHLLPEQMSQTDFIVAVNETEAINEVEPLASRNKSWAYEQKSSTLLPVKPFTLAEACESWASPEDARGVMTALLRRRFLVRAPVLPVHQRGGGDLTEDIQDWEDRGEGKQEKCVEVASHFALQAFCANCTFLLVIVATFCTPG